MNGLPREVLEESLPHSRDSPFVRSQRFFHTLDLGLELEPEVAALMAEAAAKETRTGARALRDISARSSTRSSSTPGTPSRSRTVPTAAGGW